MPERHYPRRWTIAVRASRSMTYAALVMMGVAGIWLTPTTVAGTVGEPMVYWGSVCAIAGGNIGIVGVILWRDAFERFAAWPTVIGAGIYSVSLWIIVVTEPSLTRSMQALAVTTLALSFLTRGLDLGGRAALARRDHEVSEAIKSIGERGDDDRS